MQDLSFHGEIWRTLLRSGHDPFPLHASVSSWQMHTVHYLPRPLPVRRSLHSGLMASLPAARNDVHCYIILHCIVLHYILLEWPAPSQPSWDSHFNTTAIKQTVAKNTTTNAHLLTFSNSKFVYYLFIYLFILLRVDSQPHWDHSEHVKTSISDEICDGCCMYFPRHCFPHSPNCHFVSDFYDLNRIFL